MTVVIGIVNKRAAAVGADSVPTVVEEDWMKIHC